MSKLPFPAVGRRVAFLAGFALALILLLTGTWQLALLAGFLAGMFSPRGSLAALIGGVSVASAWAAYLLYVFVLGEGLPLANLVGEILGVGPGSWWLLTFLTLVLGLLVGAVGGLLGFTGSRLFLWEEPSAAAEAPKG